jgi:Na+/H+ antiporter NhaD/arsenite permease-like protein
MTRPKFWIALGAWLVVCAGMSGLCAAQSAPAMSPATAPSVTTGPSLLPGTAGHHADISLWWSAPFALLLAAIALMPFIHRHWWEHNYPYVSFALALLVAGYYFYGRRAPGHWLHAMAEYVSFIVLLGALFVISGGISIRVNRKATPAANAGLLLIGAVIANVFGTTGAAMLLIRPFLRMNRHHIRPYHVVFFIFIVANCGGALTPIGDPPLFLGYLKGVPFWWVAEHMFAPWLLTVGLLVAIFFVIDTIDSRKEQRPHDHEAGPQVHVLGVQNFLFIAVVIVAVFRPSMFEVLGAAREKGLGHAVGLPLSREVLMLAAAVASRVMTGKAIYQANDFNYGPIREVAILFVGIFSTMVPALQWLEHNAEEKIRINRPGQFYFATGTLSAILDNAPTYMTFVQMRMAELDDADVEEAARVLAEMKGRASLSYDPRAEHSQEVRSAVGAMIKYHEADVRAGTVRGDQLQIAFLLGNPGWNIFLVAISASAVFFGACTYIGNGPNFMVKSIADAGGIKTPGFVEYVVRYTLPVLIPVYVLVWAVFFR